MVEPLVLEWVLPFAAGLGLGRLMRHDRRVPWTVAVPGVVLGGLVVLSLHTLVPVIALWDLVTVVVAASAGLLSSGLPGRTLAQALLGLTLFLGVALGVGELGLPKGPEFSGEQHKRGLWFEDQARHGEDACSAAYANHSVGDARSMWSVGLAHVDKSRPVDVHLGDSMLAFAPKDAGSDDNGAGRRFPELLDAADPLADHVNFGTPGASFDIFLLIARRALRELPVRRVVVHALLSNDLSEMGRPLSCCPAPTVLDWADPSLPATCPEARQPGAAWPALAHLVMRSPAPWWLRAASTASRTVTHARLLLMAWSAGGPWAEWQDVDDLRREDDDPVIVEGLARAEAVFAVMRDETAAAGVELVVVMMPIGPFLDQPESTARRRVEQLGAVLDRLGVAWIDAWEAFPDRPIDTSLFQADRYHLTYEGHARLASWLAQRDGYTLVPPNEAVTRPAGDGR